MRKRRGNKKKKFTLVYSRRYPFDTRAYNQNKYVPHPFDIIASRCHPDSETLRRIKPIGRERFIYVPSPEYQHLRKLVRTNVGMR